ncbi:MAG TPA: TonB-dependent receptor [Pyrinomonadaceae bacterium]
MSKNFKLVSFALSLILCFSAMAFGQRTTGDIEGTVKDPQGAVVPGASITITGVNVGFNRTVQSNAEGTYRVQEVPAGIYRISTAAIQGFAASTLESVTVNIEQITTADITLGVAGGVNEVNVSSDPLGVNVDATESKVQTNITSQLIEQLPKGTNFTSLLKVSPGTRAEPLSGGFQVDGASGSENSFVVDGQALENFRTGTLNLNNNLPTNLVQEIQIKTSGFEAEHGGASGGVISVVTRGGSDQWRGEFGMQFDVGKLNPGNRFVPSVFQASATSAQRVYSIRQPSNNNTDFYPTASLGGPIVKGRAWFYGNYSPQIFSARRTTTFYNALTESSFTGGVNTAPAGFVSGVNLTQSTLYPPGTYTSKTTQEYAFGRIDASILNNLRYTGTYLWNPTITEGQIPFNTLAVGSTPVNNRLYEGRTYTDVDFNRLRGGRTNSNNFTSQLVWTPTSRMVTSLRYGRAFLNEKNGSYAVPVGTRFRCIGLAAAEAYTTGAAGCSNGLDTGVNALAERDVSLKNEWNGDVSYSLDNFGGRHDFKGGVQYGTTKNDVKTSFSGTTPINDPFFGRNDLSYGRNFDTAFAVSGLNQFCNLRTATNPTGNCLGVGRLYRYGTQGIASNKYIGLYVQDKWQPTSRLTLNLGVRAEKENLPAFNTGGSGGGVPLEFGFGKKIAPRLGVAYDLFGDGKTRVWASFGRFYDRLKFALPRGSFGGDFYRLDYYPILASNPNYTYYTRDRILGNFKDPIGGGNPSTAGGLSILQSDFRIPSNITEAQAKALGLPFAGLDPDLKPFRQSEFTTGFERELSDIFVVTARYTRKNVDSAIEDIGILGSAASENFIIGNPGEGFAAELGRQAGYAKSIKPKRLYNGLELVLNKRLSNNYFFNLNYTLSRLEGNYSGLASSDENGRTDPGVSRYFDYPVNGFTFNGTPDDGLLPTDRTHTFKAYGGYNFDWFGSKTNQTELSFFQQVYQGTPQTTYIGIEHSSIVFSKRGDLGRTPTYYNTDLNLTHRYRFGRDDRFTLAFDVNVLNAFNNNTVLSYNTSRYSQNNTVGFSDIDPTYDPSSTNPVISNPVRALNILLNGGFNPAKVDALLATPQNQKFVRYGEASGYQAARNVRFGFRLFF